MGGRILLGRTGCEREKLRGGRGRGNEEGIEASEHTRRNLYGTCGIRADGSSKGSRVSRVPASEDVTFSCLRTGVDKTKISVAILPAQNSSPRPRRRWLSSFNAAVTPRLLCPSFLPSFC